ncbi:hypothetical protein JVU11DRAFT_5802 [Chiua virens]|nr:hypothetical protein JVU11DRAFT_5802 [Chiua virens]
MQGHLDIDLFRLMDTNQDFEQSQDGVRWVASQSPNPALQALMKEAEREKRTHEPTSWTYPLASATSLSASIGSSWQPSANSPVHASHLLPLSASTSSIPSSLAFRASEPSIQMYAKPASAGKRKPLASSTSSANQPLRGTARSRSSSHSTALSLPSTSDTNHVREEEPEAVAFIELLKDVSRQLDENSKKKQRLAARTKEKERSLGRSGIDNRTSLDA